MVCRQELVKRELIESKKSFDMIWADNASIQKLTGMIFKDDEAVVNALSEALKEVPYLALASKKSLFNTFSNCLSHADGIGVSDKDIQGFASRIFEYKKDVKKAFIQNINEKYGVNIQNLQNPASFKSLANTQVVIFEALSRLSPTGSVLKEVLSEMAQGLKTKSGVECIDVNDYLLEMFIQAGYDEVLEEAASAPATKVDFKRVSKEITDIKDIVKNLETTIKDQEYPSDETLDDKALADKESMEAPEEPAAPPEEVVPPPPPAPEPEGAPAPEEEVAEPSTPPDVKDTDEVIDDLANLENMVADIATELGMVGDDDKEKE